jgi:hypothetical protein
MYWHLSEPVQRHNHEHTTDNNNPTLLFQALISPHNLYSPQPIL